MEDHNVAMFDNLVVVVAKRFYGIIPRGEGEKELQFLHGWVVKLKKRLYSIKVYTCHGEDACGKYRKETINSNACTQTMFYHKRHLYIKCIINVCTSEAYELQAFESVGCNTLNIVSQQLDSKSKYSSISQHLFLRG